MSDPAIDAGQLASLCYNCLQALAEGRYVKLSLDRNSANKEGQDSLGCRACGFLTPWNAHIPDCHSASELLTKLCIDANAAYEAYVAHGTDEMRQLQISREEPDESLGIKLEEEGGEKEDDTAGEEEDDVERKEPVKGMELYAEFEKVYGMAKELAQRCKELHDLQQNKRTAIAKHARAKAAVNEPYHDYRLAIWARSQHHKEKFFQRLGIYQRKLDRAAKNIRQVNHDIAEKMVEIWTLVSAYEA